MKRTITAMEACRQGGHDVEHHFSRAAKMVEIGTGVRRAIADHIEDVLGMVEIGAGSSQPYEQIVGLNLTASQPVTLCHGFKGEDSHPPCGRRSIQFFGICGEFGSNRGEGAIDEEEA